MAPKLLIIEDSNSISKVIERIGLSLGYQTTIAKSFAEVKTIMAGNTKFFAATIDVNLPDAPNGEAIPYVLQSKIPSVVMTGRMDEGTRRKILGLPVIDYITKDNSQAYHYLLRVLHNQLTNKHINVLVVDDSLTSRTHISQLLKRRNFTVHSASSGLEALKVLEEKPEIKIVLTDHEMPGMSGIELLQKIRKRYSPNELIVIGISGTKREINSAKFIKSGADDFLQKPLCPEEFYCRVMLHIEKLQYIEKIDQAAQQDYLTELSNYRHFITQVTEEMEFSLDDSEEDILAVMTIDNFNHINDELGSEIGDKVLTDFAGLLKKHFNKSIVSRFGGAKFAVFVTPESISEGKEKLAELQSVVSKHKTKIKEVETTFSISIGGTSINRDKSVEALVTVAKQALTQAKNKGSNQFVLNT